MAFHVNFRSPTQPNENEKITSRHGSKGQGGSWHSCDEGMFELWLRNIPKSSKISRLGRNIQFCRCKVCRSKGERGSATLQMWRERRKLNNNQPDKFDKDTRCLTIKSILGWWIHECHGVQVEVEQSKKRQEFSRYSVLKNTLWILTKQQIWQTCLTKVAKKLLGNCGLGKFWSQLLYSKSFDYQYALTHNSGFKPFSPPICPTTTWFATEK